MAILDDLVARMRCVGCGAPAPDLCPSCADGLEPIGATICRRCGSPCAHEADGCAGCRDLGGFARARSLVRYGGPASRLALAVKRTGSPGLARGAGTLLADLAVAHGLAGSPPLTVAFVPAGRRARRRGFDHAELLARAVARRLDVRCVRALRRARDLGRQADAGLDTRRGNVAGAFRSRPVAGTILLVDDVFTTGATAEACALALTESGAERVHVVTWARTVRRRA